MMTAADTYAALVDAANAQRVRLHGEETPGARWDHEVAQRSRFDPHRIREERRHELQNPTAAPGR